MKEEIVRRVNKSEQTVCGFVMQVYEEQVKLFPNVPWDQQAEELERRHKAGMLTKKTYQRMRKILDDYEI
jgi:hypothetical protein